MLAVTETLDDAGVPYRILHTGAHVKVHYEAGGVPHIQVCSKTPSCRLAERNAVSQVRRALRAT